MIRIWNDITTYTDDEGVTSKMLTIYVSANDKQMNITRKINDEKNAKEICTFIEIALETMLNTLIDMEKVESEKGELDNAVQK